MTTEFIGLVALSAGTFSGDAKDSLNNLFVANKGQWSEHVRFHASQAGTSLWVTDRGPQFDFHRNVLRNGKTVREGQRVWLEFDRPAQPVAEVASPVRMSYFRGDESSWVKGAPTYRSVRLSGAARGIDQKFYFDQGAIRYDFIVHPGADPQALSFRIRGAEGIAGKGKALTIRTKLGDVLMTGLFAYQEANGLRKPVPCSFTTEGNRVSFRLGQYDRSKPLVIDPIVYSRFVGAGEGALYTRVVAGPNRTSYVAMSTNVEQFNGIDDGYYVVNSGEVDVLVTHRDEDGDLVAGSFLGGSRYDYVNGINLRADGNLVIAGSTSSRSYPTTVGAYMRRHSSDYASFLTVLSPMLDDLVASTFLNPTSSYTSDWESTLLAGVVSFSTNEVVVAGRTASPALPVTLGAVQPVFSGESDGYILQFSGDLKRVTYGTYYGGRRNDVIRRIVKAPDGQLIVVGMTESNVFNDGFRITPGVVKTEHTSGRNIPFAAKLSTSKALVSRHSLAMTIGFTIFGVSTRQLSWGTQTWWWAVGPGRQR